MPHSIPAFSTTDTPLDTARPRRGRMAAGLLLGMRQFPALLILLAFAPACLLFYALSEFRMAARMASDINLSGSLRYRSLWLYGATTSKHTTTALDWRTELADMAQVRAGLVQRYPLEASITTPAWNVFLQRLDQTGSVDWETTETMRRAANNLTNTLDSEVQQHNAEFTRLFAGGIACLALTIPWGFFLNRQLGVSEREKDHRAAEVAAVSSRFRDLFQGIPAACFTYDSEGRIDEWNRAAERLFGKTVTEITGQPLWEVLSRQERREAAQDLVRQVLGGLFLTDLEWVYLTPNQSVRHVLTTVFPLRDTAGKIQGGISVSVDITERHQAEEKVRRLLEEAASSEAHLKSVTARAQCLLWEAEVREEPVPAGYDEPLFDAHKRTCLVWKMTVLDEEQAYQWLEIARASAAGETNEAGSFLHDWERSIPLEDRRRLSNNTITALRCGEPRYVHEFRTRTAMGRERWLLEKVEIEPQTPGVWRLVGVGTDITERHLAEERLRSVAAELSRSNAALEEFASIASHDLKEPLRKIQTFGSMLERRAAESLGADGIGYVTRMMSAAGRMQALVDGLMEYSRVTRRSRAYLPVDLNEIVSGVLGDLEAAIVETGAQIHVDALPSLFADGLQMRQLFQNLIGNALKFAVPGSSPVVFVRGEASRDNKVCLTVSDQGIGFDAKYKDRIFEMFEQLKSGKAGEGGTGVGLAICRKIVERHGGTIEASSTPGQGAVFTLRLPREPNQEPAGLTA